MTRIIEQVVKTILYVPMVALVLLMLLVVANIVGRALKFPFFGSAELIGFLSVILVSLSLAYTALRQSNIVVRFLVSRLPENTRLIFTIAACLLSIGTTALLTWSNGLNSWRMMLKKESTFLLNFPLAWLRYVVVIGLILLGAVLTLDLCRAIAKISRR